MPTSFVFFVREILTGLHDVMASRASAQAKLNKVVKIIADAMASEVCSIYLLRDGVLELYATVGLNQSAVHVAKLALGEGLVGTIARAALTANAGLAARAAAAATAARDQGTARLSGLKIVVGMARGVAVYHQPRVLIEQTV